MSILWKFEIQILALLLEVPPLPPFMEAGLYGSNLNASCHTGWGRMFAQDS